MSKRTLAEALAAAQAVIDTLPKPVGITCVNEHTYGDAHALEEAWWQMVQDACKANGEDPDRLGRARAIDIFQCPLCHGDIPAHLR
jgi:hypothetical protein